MINYFFVLNLKKGKQYIDKEIISLKFHSNISLLIPLTIQI